MRCSALPPLVILVALGCSGSTDVGNPVPASVVLSSDSVTAYPGKATKLPTATVYDSAHRVISSGVRWTAADLAIARISTGAVIGYGEGSTTITASAGTAVSGVVSASAHVFVVQEPVVAFNSNLNGRTLVGEDSLHVYAWGVGPFDDSLAGHPVTLTALLPALATLSSAGIVHIHGTGTAKLLASTDGFTDTIFFNVDARRIARITVMPESLLVAVGQETQSISIGVYDTEGDLLPYWYASATSSNTQIVLWDDYFGSAIGVSVGSAEIILKADTVVVHLPVIVTAH
jgi:hypothetical protein